MFVDVMLDVIGFGSTDELINNTIPDSIRLKSNMDLDIPLSETQFLESFKNCIASIANSMFLLGIIRLTVKT